MTTATATPVRVFVEEGEVRVTSQTDPATAYRVAEPTSLFPQCECPAAQHSRECIHTVAVLEWQQQVMKVFEIEGGEMPETATREPGTAVVPVRRPFQQAIAERAAIQRQAAGQLGGSYADLLPIARAMAAANLLPASESSGAMKPEAAALVMMRALELGIPPMSAFEFLFVVGNKVKMQGQMVQALIQRDGRGRIEIEESNNDRCTATGYREGHPPLRVTWTIQDAQTAGLMNNFGWKKYPADMLVWKVIARIGRRLFADILGGMDVADSSGATLDTALPALVGDGEPDTFGGGHAAVLDGEYRPVDTDIGPEESLTALEYASRYGIELKDLVRHTGVGMSQANANGRIEVYAAQEGLSVEAVVAAAAGRPLPANAEGTPAESQEEAPPETDAAPSPGATPPSAEQLDAFSNELTAALNEAKVMPMALQSLINAPWSYENAYDFCAREGLTPAAFVAKAKEAK